MPDLNFDFVYSPEDELNFINLSITLGVVESGTTHQYQLTITSDTEIADGHIIDIISELNKKKFDRMRVDVEKDCKVMLSIAGDTREIDITRIKEAVGLS